MKGLQLQYSVQEERVKNVQFQSLLEEVHCAGLTCKLD